MDETRDYYMYGNERERVRILEFAQPRISNDGTQHGGEVAEHNKSMIENDGSRFAKAKNIAHVKSENR